MRVSGVVFQQVCRNDAKKGGAANGHACRYATSHTHLFTRHSPHVTRFQASKPSLVLTRARASWGTPKACSCSQVCVCGVTVCVCVCVMFLFADEVNVQTVGRAGLWGLGMATLGKLQ